MWKTCRNEWYGWEFRYPAEWHVYKGGNGLVPGVCHGSQTYMGEWKPGTLESIYLNASHQSVTVTSGDTVWSHGVAYPDVETLATEITKNSHTRARGYYNVGGHTFVWLTGMRGGLYVWHKRQAIRLHHSPKVDEQLMETILSTFRFFEPRTAVSHPSALMSNSPQKKMGTSDWQTCRNNEYGYRFVVPRDWNFFAEDPYTTVEECTGPVVQASNYKRAQVHATSQPMVVRIMVEDASETLNEYWATVAQGPDEPTYTRYQLDSTEAIRGASYNFNTIGRYREYWDIVLFNGGYKYTVTITMTPTRGDASVVETILASFTL